MEVERRLSPIAVELLAGLRAVVVNGPRQAGKSTLVRHIQRGRGPVVNLDDVPVRDAAVADPVGFLRTLPPGSAIDEFQRGGDELLLALKAAIDVDSARGQYVLAGSTRFLTTRRLADTLTGRIGIVELLPLSAGELRGRSEVFVERVFEGEVPGDDVERATRADYAEVVAAGGFPEIALGPASPRVRTAWCASYLETVTAVANVEQVASIRRPDALRSILDQVAARTSGELVAADLARELAVDEGTIRSYLDVLATLYLVRLVPAWTTSHTNRSKRRPVMHLIDTALTAHLLGASPSDLAEPTSPWFGPLLESYVVGELHKQATWSELPVAVRHYRDRDQREVDVVLERGRQVVGIEVKATATPRETHARHLAFLRDRLGDRFTLGVVLHTGDHIVGLGDRLIAAPVSTLWAD